MKPDRRFPLLPRKKSVSKFDFGHALIVAGSGNMPGAAVLAATACLRAGAGLVTVACPMGIRPVLQKKLPPEIMCLGLPQTRTGTLGKNASAALLKWMSRRRIQVVLIGPGLTTEAGSAAVVRALIARLLCPVVLDADGLNVFKSDFLHLRRSKAPLVLTPHDGEFRRLFDAKVPPGLVQRVNLAKQTAARYHGVLVLKGHRTVVADERRVFVNSTGNPGLAKGGSGDTLSGILAAFLAQGLDAFTAAAWAVYMHGAAADLAVRQTSELGLTASDVIGFLPHAFRRYG